MSLPNCKKISYELPILIAGSTASGKSSLALEIAKATGREIVNADALQVYACWRILTARPDAGDEATASHKLYGHVKLNRPYSVGDWLREVTSLLDTRPAPIIVGGTGLYFRALTEGLADIPPTPPDIRQAADARLAELGVDLMASELDSPTAAKIDLKNPVRVQRAWEVLNATGRGLADWQAETPAPFLPLENCHALVLHAEKDWLDARIIRRFDHMLANGALEEVRAVEPHWDPVAPWAKAIGAPELISHLRGACTLAQARDAAILASRQYAKRQRTWFRSRMSSWEWVSAGR
ncbi:MAG: tRNA (adenosine(37)-N6)-dimethylallyltransferase MiaA [Pseudomonadota bacterium]